MFAQIIGAVQPALEWIKLWWGYLTVLAAICAAVYGKAILPVVRRRRAKREKQEKQQQEIVDMLADIKGQIRGLSDNVATLQHDRLQQAYIRYMKRGWCESDTKESLVAMFDDYTASGRNHLYRTYKEDIMNLPEVEPGRSWGARAN